jgi:hypothetical protein
VKPVNCRNRTFTGIRSELHGRLQGVYCAWIAHGPCTTRQLAARAGLDILNVRPRTTELVQMGLVELVDGNGREGVYRARSQAEWEAWEGEQRSVDSGQLILI